MEFRNVVVWLAANRWMPRLKVLEELAAKDAEPLKMLGLGVDAHGWSSVVATGMLAGFAFALLPAYVLTSSALLAPLLSAIAALLFGYAILAIPQVLAARKTEKMERALPSFLSSLVSVYATTRNMRAALLNSSDADYGPLSAELKEAVILYELTGDEGQAFKRLTGNASRDVSAAFELITASLSTGIDVSESLNLLAKGVASSLEAQDDKNSKTGITIWSMTSASAFFFPFIAGIAYDSLLMLERLNGAPLYSESEKGLLLFTLAAYAFVSVAQDSAFIGSVRHNSMARGIATYFPIFAVISLTVMAVVIKFGSVLV